MSRVAPLLMFKDPDPPGVHTVRARPDGLYHLAPLFHLQVSEDTFLQGCECAWSHLKEDFGTTASIRATCRGGRMLFDQHLKKLVPVLWEQRNNNDNSDQHVPSKDLCQSMLNLLNRGAKPPCLHLQYYNPQMDNNTDLGLSLWPPNVREEQL